MKDDGLFAAIYEAVKKIPYGKVASYGQIAAAVGRPRCARQVGWALHSNPDPQNIPCYRVVNRQGKTAAAFAFGGEDMQKKLLEAEGVKFDSAGLVERRYFMD